MARPEKDYCLKFDATELDPDTTYYYRFFHSGSSRPLAHQTAPSRPSIFGLGSVPAPVRLWLFPCLLAP